MKALRIYISALCLTLIVLSACNNRGTEASGNDEPAVNVTDSRKNTDGSVNTITGDSNKVATDSAQHGIRKQDRKNM